MLAALKESFLDEIHASDYKEVAKDIKKEYGKKVKKKDIVDYIQQNADSPHKIDPDEIAFALKKIGVRVEGLEEKINQNRILGLVGDKIKERRNG